jgi:hypothetical protein
MSGESSYSAKHRAHCAWALVTSSRRFCSLLLPALQSPLTESNRSDHEDQHVGEVSATDGSGLAIPCPGPGRALIGLRRVRDTALAPEEECSHEDHYNDRADDVRSVVHSRFLRLLGFAGA